MLVSVYAMLSISRMRLSSPSKLAIVSVTSSATISQLPLHRCAMTRGLGSGGNGLGFDCGCQLSADKLTLEMTLQGMVLVVLLTLAEPVVIGIAGVVLVLATPSGVILGLVPRTHLSARSGRRWVWITIRHRQK